MSEKQTAHNFEYPKNEAVKFECEKNNAQTSSNVRKTRLGVVRMSEKIKHGQVGAKKSDMQIDFADARLSKAKAARNCFSLYIFVALEASSSSSAAAMPQMWTLSYPEVRGNALLSMKPMTRVFGLSYPMPQWILSPRQT